MHPAHEKANNRQWRREEQSTNRVGRGGRGRTLFSVFFPCLGETPEVVSEIGVSEVGSLRRPSTCLSVVSSVLPLLSDPKQNELNPLTPMIPVLVQVE